MKCIYTFSFLFAFQFCFAQSYHAFPDSDAKWSEESYGFMTPQKTDLKISTYRGRLYEVGGDTIVNSRKYTLVTSKPAWTYTTSYYWTTPLNGVNDTTVYSIQNYSLETPGTVFAAIREDSSKKVWFISISEYPPICLNAFIDPLPVDTEMLLYDFGLQIGDTLTFPFYRKVQAIDSIQLEDNSFRRRIIFSDAFTQEDYWIEGIGSVFGLFGSLNYPGPDADCWLNCFSQNGEYLFHKTPFPERVTCDSTMYGKAHHYTELLVTINLTDNVAVFDFNEDHHHIQIINSLGELIYESDVQGYRWVFDLSPLPDGMYYAIVGTEGKLFSTQKLVKI
ncbi:MAG TPA: hypothetical protein VE978_23805 [Chitinophagales bacterium]|nr:hypothetical protein [Chitinophagales bacterium]